MFIMHHLRPKTICIDIKHNHRAMAYVRAYVQGQFFSFKINDDNFFFCYEVEDHGLENTSNSAII